MTIDPATIRCPVCGVPWDEHDITVICERYRPRSEIRSRLTLDLINEALLVLATRGF